MMRRSLLACFLLVMALLLISSSAFESAVARPGYCSGKCSVRCAKAGVKDRCVKYCQLCCAKCKCVPSGTYGNKHQCPCYRDLKNSKGKPKCP